MTTRYSEYVISDQEAQRRAKLSMALLGNKNALGKRYSDETRARMRISSRARWGRVTEAELDRMRYDARRALHTRWHINRNQSNPACAFCSQPDLATTV